MEQKILLTAGPICPSMRVKEAMLRDLGTRDHEYQDMVEQLRNELLQLAHVDADTHSVVFLQGSGTYGVESVLDSSVGKKGKVLILSNGAYGERMEQICSAHGISHQMQSFSKLEALPVEKLESYIKEDSITHVAFIHCETTAGVLNDLEAILKLTHKYHKRSIVDAMSSFGSMEMNLKELDMDFLITAFRVWRLSMENRRRFSSAKAMRITWPWIYISSGRRWKHPAAHSVLRRRPMFFWR